MPRQSSPEYELWQCCQTLRQALVDTIADIDRGRIEGDTIDRDMSFIRTQLGRRDVLLSVLAQRRAYRAQVHPEYITGDWPPQDPAATVPVGALSERPPTTANTHAAAAVPVPVGALSATAPAPRPPSTAAARARSRSSSSSTSTAAPRAETRKRRGNSAM